MSTGIEDEKFREAQARCKFAVKSPLFVVLSKAAPLRNLLIGNGEGRLTVHASVLEHIAIYASAEDADEIMTQHCRKR
jgi:hypothetical protein